MSRYDAHTDEHLFLLLQEGDKGAFSALYHRHFRQLLRFACSYVKDTELGEDIVQDVFFNLWQRHDSLKPQSLARYLYQSTKNAVIDHIRAEATRKQYAAEFSVMVATRPNHTEDLLNEQILKARIEKSIAQLPARTQLAFRLSRYEHVPVREIAERMNISPRTVEDYLTKALAHLRVSLGEFMVVVLFLLY